MANFAAIIANRGYYYVPHLVKYYGDDSVRNENYYTKHETNIPKEYWIVNTFFQVFWAFFQCFSGHSFFFTANVDFT